MQETSARVIVPGLTSAVNLVNSEAAPRRHGEEQFGEVLSFSACFVTMNSNVSVKSVCFHQKSLD